MIENCDLPGFFQYLRAVGLTWMMMIGHDDQRSVPQLVQRFVFRNKFMPRLQFLLIQIHRPAELFLHPAGFGNDAARLIVCLNDPA